MASDAGNLWKFTPSEDGLSYRKIIPENELDVDLDDQCKYQKWKAKSPRDDDNLFQSFILIIISIQRNLDVDVTTQLVFLMIFH